jgi:hypothetical protein
MSCVGHTNRSSVGLQRVCESFAQFDFHLQATNRYCSWMKTWICFHVFCCMNAVHSTHVEFYRDFDELPWNVRVELWLPGNRSDDDSIC